MSNQKRLEEYLVGDKGYLKKDILNGKVIMLSGKWGSGKTFFWKNIIATDEFKKELSDKNRAYSYVSLYGKSSIEEIENDIFAQIYFSVIGGDNLVTKTFSTFTKYSKRYGNLFSSFDFSKLAEALENEQKDNKERVALERLKNGAIICFDDFERKSKDIDLNDLFGFITNLTIEFYCKVVIILNDDVFEAEEKKIFSNVKEKSVSKFLKYEPSIRDLFKSIIFEKNGEEKFKYLILKKHLKIILETIEKTKELNARIYIQVLDNLVEWIEKNQETDEHVLKCLILVNINFILNHNILKRGGISKTNDSSFFNYPLKELEEYFNSTYFEEYYDNYRKYEIDLINKIGSNEYLENFYKNNKNLFKSHYFANKFSISENVNDKTFQKINNFIETGIII